MKVEKYKYLGNNKYKVLLDNEEIILYEDIIVKYGILLKKEMTIDEKNMYLKDNIYYELYYAAIKFINIKLRSEKEIRKYLKKLSSDEYLIDAIIKRIRKENYLNDRIYARSYIHDVMNFKLDGPLKIANELEELGIDKDIVLEELSVFTNEIKQEKIKKYIDKQVKLNKNKSFYALQSKIINYLTNQGYTKEDITNYLNTVSFDDSALKQKEYEKLYKKLSTKYSGKELEYKINQKMYAKGFKN